MGKVKMSLCLVCLLWLGCSSKPSLSPEEQRAWNTFIDKQLSLGMVQPTSQDASAVATLGNKIVPQVVEHLGKAYRGPGGKGDYWLVIVLARIGTPQAIDGIIKVLKHDYPGKVSLDREIAAKALVWLGATRGIPDLEAAIADTEKQAQAKLDEEKAQGKPQKMLEFHAFDYRRWSKPLKDAVEQLKQGKGKRDVRNFPFE